MEQARRPALAHHVHRTAPMGPRVLINGIWYYLSAAELAAKLQPYFPHGFMVEEINAGNINGILPEEAWTWFYMKHHEKQSELPGLDVSSYWPTLLPKR